MKRNVIITWVVLLVVLAGCLGGFGLRYQNEIRNNKVVTAVDYREFRSAANFADLDLASIMADLKTAGVQNVAVKETTVRDLSERGDIGLYSYAEFSAEMKSYPNDIWPQIQRHLQGQDINPSNRVLVSSDPQITQFLQERSVQPFYLRGIDPVFSSGPRLFCSANYFDRSTPHCRQQNGKPAPHLRRPPGVRRAPLGCII
jgi:hypothetical protein